MSLIGQKMTRLNQNCPLKMRKRKKERNIDVLKIKKMKLSVKVIKIQNGIHECQERKV